MKATYATESALVIVPFTLRSPAEMTFFLNIQKVVKVAEAVGLSPLPQAMAPFCGLYDLAGTPVPVVDLGPWLANAPVPAVPEASPRRLIICESLGLLVGLIVDGTRKVRRQSNASIVPPPAACEPQQRMYVSGIVKDADGFCYMLDLERLFQALGIVAEASPPGEPELLLAGRRVLVVDDSRYYQKLVAKALRRRGARVDLAEDGEAGLRLALAANPGYDALVVDVEMPRLSGIEMVRAYRRQAAQPSPVLFHSAITNPVLAADLVKEGLGGYVSKFDEDAVIERVLELLAKPQSGPAST